MSESTVDRESVSDGPVGGEGWTLEWDEHGLSVPLPSSTPNRLVTVVPEERLREAEAQRDEALLDKGRREAVIEALARSEGEPENTVLRSVLAVIFAALGGRFPSTTTDAATFALDRIEAITDAARELEAELARARESTVAEIVEALRAEYRWIEGLADNPADFIGSRFGASREQERHEGEHCQDCGHPYELVWTAPDDLWQAIMDGPGGLLCVDCFDRRCREAGKDSLRWVPVPLSDPVPEREVERLTAVVARLRAELDELAEATRNSPREGIGMWVHKRASAARHIDAPTDRDVGLASQFREQERGEGDGSRG